VTKKAPASNEMMTSKRPLMHPVASKTASGEEKTAAGPTKKMDATRASTKAASSSWKPRSPAQIEKEGNHLKNEGSFYLRQHANNPLEWYPWGAEALARSKAEDKPIFLSIGYSSCHWCHVMEHKVFEHQDVAEFMNANFINIKVDREERPDLDKVYMDAVQAMTGRGGWPMTVFLTPDLKPFVGGTYFPKNRFMPLAQKVLNDFRTNRAEVTADGKRYYDKIKKNPDIWGSSPITEDMLLGMARQVSTRIDPVWGGFQRQRTKFPVPPRWTYLMHAYRKWGDPAVGKALRVTLDKMASGGMYDHVGGGFHRYSVEKTWVVPHFEKMLYDNGQLASMYIEAGAALGDSKYSDIGRDVLEFMLSHMNEPGGGFYSSWDADSGGHEGSYYVWTPSDIDALASGKEAAILKRYLSITPGGNFEGKTIPTRRVPAATVASELGGTAANVTKVWQTYRPKMAVIRDRRVKPGLDKKIVTAWNGLAIGAFAKGYQAFGDPRYRQAAEAASDFLWTHHRRPNWGVFRASNKKQAQFNGVLDDYSFLADGLLDLYSATGELKHFIRAKTLMDEANQHFRDAQGSWFLTQKNQDTPLGRQVVPWDSVRPSGISRMLQASLKMAALTASESLHRTVDTVLGAYANSMRGSGLGMAGWYTVALANKGPFYELIIAGDADDPNVKALNDVVTKLRPSWVVKAGVPGAGPDARLKSLVPATEGKVARKGKAQAYVCVRGACNAPTGDPQELRAQLLKGWRY
jgi:uncharacterized protein YyaL (SSP411 family)